MRNITFTALVVFATAQTAFAQLNTAEWKFTNKTGAKALDLHLKFNKPVTWTGDTPKQNPTETFKRATPANNPTVGLAKGPGTEGTGVPKDKSVTIEFNYEGTKPKLKQAWWTFTNNHVVPANSEQGAVPLRVVDELKNEWAMTPATGDGLVAVTIDRFQSIFRPTPGDDGAESAARFAQFISAMPYGDVLDFTGGQVIYTGRSYSDDMNNVIVDVLRQDSTQPVDVAQVPEPCLSAAMLVGPSLLLGRRRRSAV